MAIAPDEAPIISVADGHPRLVVDSGLGGVALGAMPMGTPTPATTQNLVILDR